MNLRTAGRSAQRTICRFATKAQCWPHAKAREIRCRSRELTLSTIDVAGPYTDAPVLELYEAGLSSQKLWAQEAGGERFRLPVADWSSSRLPGDESLISRCDGPTLDVGCGPGRLVAALAQRGEHALGIDISSAAVSQARSRGSRVNALQRCVFGPVPGAGLWEHALLADGNIGIGGDPVALLRRVSNLLTEQGLIHVEVSAPGAPSTVRELRLQDVTRRISEPFSWAEVGVDGLEAIATAGGLGVKELWSAAGRWFASLQAMPRFRGSFA